MGSVQRRGRTRQLNGAPTGTGPPEKMTNYIAVVIVKTTWEHPIFLGCHVQSAAMTHLLELPHAIFDTALLLLFPQERKHFA